MRITTERSAQAVLTTKGVTVAYRHPTPTTPDMGWACAGIDPEQFFPEDEATLAGLGRSAPTARCRTCAVNWASRAASLACGEACSWRVAGCWSASRSWDVRALGCLGAVAAELVVRLDPFLGDDG